MRKLVVYITRVLNVKLALSFYISVYMQNQCLIFYQHKQWIQITAISHQNAYKKVFWLKFQGGACPPDPLDCARRKLCAVRKLCAARKLCAGLKPNHQVPWCFLIFLGETLPTSRPKWQSLNDHVHVGQCVYKQSWTCVVLQCTLQSWYGFAYWLL